MRNFASKLKKIYALVIAGGLSFLPLVAAAAPFDNLRATLSSLNAVLGVLLIVIFGIAVVVFSWGVVKYISAAGDAAKLKEARSFILWGIILIFVLVAIFGLVKYLSTAIGLERDVSDIKPPTLPPTSGATGP